MIHEGQCIIVVKPDLGSINLFGTGEEPSIPTDEEMEEVFKDWKLRSKIFIGRCCQAEDKESRDHLTPQDLFRYGMKFAICEAKKLV
jgi:hypothetical protein